MSGRGPPGFGVMAQTGSPRGGTGGWAGGARALSGTMEGTAMYVGRGWAAREKARLHVGQRRGGLSWGWDEGQVCARGRGPEASGVAAGR